LHQTDPTAGKTNKPIFMPVYSTPHGVGFCFNLSGKLVDRQRTPTKQAKHALLHAQFSNELGTFGNLGLSEFGAIFTEVQNETNRLVQRAEVCFSIKKSET